MNNSSQKLSRREEENEMYAPSKKQRCLNMNETNIDEWTMRVHEFQLHMQDRRNLFREVVTDFHDNQKYYVEKDYPLLTQVPPNIIPWKPSVMQA